MRMKSAIAVVIAPPTSMGTAFATSTTIASGSPMSAAYAMVPVPFMNAAVGPFLQAIATATAISSTPSETVVGDARPTTIPMASAMMRPTTARI